MQLKIFDLALPPPDLIFVMVPIVNQCSQEKSRLQRAKTTTLLQGETVRRTFEDAHICKKNNQTTPQSLSAEAGPLKGNPAC